MRRVALAACFGLLAAGAVASDERRQLLAQGEAALQRLEVAAAIAAFDRAAALQHAADSEMGLVRAYMQGGEYRRALAFVAHAAGAHREVPQATGLHAWLLYLGGQAGAARRMLDEARANPDRMLAEVRKELASGAPRASGLLLELPARLAPYGAPASLPATARVAGTAMVVGSTRALVPLDTIRDSASLWVRNGLGNISRARVRSRHADLGVAVLDLDTVMPVDPELTMAPRDAFPGSVAFVVEHAAAPGATPAWPVLSSGFLGAATDAANRPLGIELPRGPRGGPVFDAAGRFIGLSVAGRDKDQLVAASRLRPLLVDIPVREASARERAPVDHTYERALRTAVQVIVAK